MRGSGRDKRHEETVTQRYTHGDRDKKIKRDKNRERHRGSNRQKQTQRYIQRKTMRETETETDRETKRGVTTEKNQ